MKLKGLYPNHFCALARIAAKVGEFTIHSVTDTPTTVIFQITAGESSRQVVYDKEKQVIMP